MKKSKVDEKKDENIKEVEKERMKDWRKLKNIYKVNYEF